MSSDSEGTERNKIRQRKFSAKPTLDELIEVRSKIMASYENRGEGGGECDDLDDTSERSNATVTCPANGADAASGGAVSCGPVSGISNGASDEDDKLILEPYTYILQIPGKNIRTKLCQAFDYWLHVPPDKLAVISEIAQMLHNASLLIDDIEDNSVLRRGLPVAHSIYGVPNTINAANFVYFLGLQRALTLQHPRATTIFTEQLLELHRGQGMDIYWRDSVTVPTIEQYKRMVIRKTGGLFGLAVRLMQLFSTAPASAPATAPVTAPDTAPDNVPDTAPDAAPGTAQRDYKPLADTLGLYFQIRDDYANLTSSVYTDNKSYCEDFTEGKFSFPIIHAIRHAWAPDPSTGRPPNSQILYILKQRTHSVEVKRYAVSLLHDYGSFIYTKDALIELECSALKQISELGGNPLLVALITELRKVYTTEDNGGGDGAGAGAAAATAHSATPQGE